jgi:hypothetical protein
LITIEVQSKVGKISVDEDGRLVEIDINGIIDSKVNGLVEKKKKN